MNCVCPGCGKALSEQLPHQYDSETDITIIVQTYEVALCADCTKKLEDSIDEEK